MYKHCFYSVILLTLITSQSAFSSEDSIQNDLDGFWAEASRVVAEGDFEAYQATYHQDAILVSESSQSSYPVAQAMEGWEQGFIDTKTGDVTASVEFRFTQRYHDVTTAHEQGIFHYKAVPVEGEPTDIYIHFEALLIYKNGWKTMMEYQKSPATREEWEEASEQ